MSWRYELSAALADQRTASGERRRLVLPDGTLLELNTATAVDVRFDEQQRSVVLHGGEILVGTAHDPLGRPFTVVTPEGRLVPVGTRFVVRRDDAPTRASGVTRLAVTEGMVQIHPADGAGETPVLVKASEQAYFSRHQVTAVQPLREAGLAWTEGVLVAEGMPLGDFIAELSRYHRGRLRCEAEVAHLRITGTWPLAADSPSEAILASLERQLPVRVRRFTRYWVTVAAR
ncbi:FecR domain-containing protein [Pseudomonas sp. GD04015]|nr:FecR domain-containing protein [Pseudomonas sp. GD04042]MDH0483335.1 FecR domain-containing protein [Pseudomonas sp. GD04015]